MADKLDVEFALIHRKRASKAPNAPERMEILVGDVKDKVCSLDYWHSHLDYNRMSCQVAILVDDMVNTGHTLTLAAKTLHEKGAKSVHALISHGTCSIAIPLVAHSPFSMSGLFSEMNLHMINELPIVELVVTNTVPQGPNQEICSKLRTVDISFTIAESIRRTHNGESISLLFGEWADSGAISILPPTNGIHANE